MAKLRNKSGSQSYLQPNKVFDDKIGLTVLICNSRSNKANYLMHLISNKLEFEK